MTRRHPELSARVLSPLTDRDYDVLYTLHTAKWETPLMLGSWNGSHHANTLRKLVMRGLVSTRQRWERTDGATGPDAYAKTRARWRGSRAYRLTPAGAKVRNARRTEESISIV